MSKQKNNEVVRENELEYLQKGGLLYPKSEASIGESFYRKVWPYAS